jgi:hypothetical protein
MVHGSFDCHLDSALAFRTAAELVVMGDSRFVESYRWELSFFPATQWAFAVIFEYYRIVFPIGLVTGLLVALISVFYRPSVQATP